MKLNFTRTFLALAAATLFYTGCKKDTVKPAVTTPVTTATDFKALSSQTALMFYKSINGQYGGTDISKGISSPFSTKTGRRVVNSIAPLCGFVIDTSYNYTIDNGQNKLSLTDTLKTYSGRFRFQFTCTSGNVDGYDVADTVDYIERNAFTFYNSISVAQNYNVKALDQTYKLVSMDGTLTSWAGYDQTFAEQGTSLNASYVLAGLRVNFASGIADITQGTATFHIVYYPLHSFDVPFTPSTYDGSIQFLGNHMAKLTINPGHVYMVNLLTGVVTPV